MISAYQGVFEIYRNGVLIDAIHNKVTDNYLDYLIKTLLGIPPPGMKIKYLALGSQGGDLGDNPVKLGDEIFRTQYTAEPEMTSTGAVRTEFVVLAAEAIGEIKEIGIFAGDAATTAFNSGILISRIPWTYTKTGSDEITIIRNDSIRRA